METRSYTLLLPLRVPKTKTKDFALNLNEYRNANYYTLNASKKRFAVMMENMIAKLPKFDVIQLHYRYFPGRDSDTNNFGSIVDKFFCDCLVDKGKLEDDNFHFLTDTRFSFAEVDKQNPRMEVTITGTIKEESMQITLNDEEVHKALEDYVRGTVNVPEGKTLEIDLKAGRGDNGNSAIIEIVDIDKPSSDMERAARRTEKPSARVEETLSPEPEKKAAEKPKPKSVTKPKETVKPAPEPEPETPNEEEAEAPSDTKPLFGNTTESNISSGSDDRTDPNVDVKEEVVEDTPPEEPSSEQPYGGADTDADDSDESKPLFSFT